MSLCTVYWSLPAGLTQLWPSTCSDLPCCPQGHRQPQGLAQALHVQLFLGHFRVESSTASQHGLFCQELVPALKE